MTLIATYSLGSQSLSQRSTESDEHSGGAGSIDPDVDELNELDDNGDLVEYQPFC